MVHDYVILHFTAIKEISLVKFVNANVAVISIVPQVRPLFTTARTIPNSPFSLRFPWLFLKWSVHGLSLISCISVLYSFPSIRITCRTVMTCFRSGKKETGVTGVSRSIFIAFSSYSESSFLSFRQDDILLNNTTLPRVPNTFDYCTGFRSCVRLAWFVLAGITR